MSFARRAERGGASERRGSSAAAAPALTGLSKIRVDDDADNQESHRYMWWLGPNKFDCKPHICEKK